MKKFLLCLVMLILLIPAMPVAAQEPGTPEDNACNPGGAMYRENPAEGCNSEWHWVCGYYMARFYTRSYNMGGYDTSLVPDWCASLLPPRPETPAAISLGTAELPLPSGGCEVLFTNPSNSYVDFGGGYMANGLTIYSDAACTNASGVAGEYVYAPSGYSPDALCKSAYGASFEAIFADPGTNVWFCRKP